ncbi:hypothetical protein ACH427_15760 [Streptomyces sp. NPDC020379]|uniref:hypothetical protein n=1 Tax=Streptomyces sp. NPDC020379 TaxID=3365071 RepID=UPI003799D7EC
MLERLPWLADSGFTAHALLAATRADLGEHLVRHERVPREELRDRLAHFTTRVPSSH